jgi:diguanylate cyclase (GGDEF)-like protein
MPPAPVTQEQEQSLVSRVLAQGYDRLRFPEPLEREFRRDHLIASRRWVRMSLFVALATTTGFAIIDHWVIHAQNAVPDLMRFGLQFPVILLSLLATSPKLYARWYQPGIQITAPMFGLGTVLMAAYALPEHTPLVGARVLLVAFFFYFMLGLRAMQALRANAFVGTALIVAALSGLIAADVATYLAFAFFCANVIGFAGAYALEHANRTSFLERQLLVEIAALDGLTRLLNRQTFESRVRDAWRKAMTERRAVGVIMIDVDHFKLYNDHYGHQAGDDCLRRVSTAVRVAVACGPEDFVARYGGEEIIVVLADRTHAETQAIAQRIVEQVVSLQIPHASAPEARHVTVSVGATSHHPPFTSSYDTLVKLADGALYDAKRSGRNRSVFVEARSAVAA